MNLTEVKMNNNDNTMKLPLSTSDIFYPYAESEYDKLKEEEHRNILKEIKRVSLEDRNI